MRVATKILCLGAVTLSLCGCLDPRFTRYPAWYTAHPAAENKAFEHHDPFPDPDLGPDTLSRPRGFIQPRSEPTRAAQQRLFQGLRVTPESMPPSNFPSSRRYPHSVRQ